MSKLGLHANLSKLFFPSLLRKKNGGNANCHFEEMIEEFTMKSSCGLFYWVYGDFAVCYDNAWISGMYVCHLHTSMVARISSFMSISRPKGK